MIFAQRILLTIIFTLTTISTFAAAPIVTDSENFVMMDESAPTDEQPLAHQSADYNEEPLAREDTPSNHVTNNADLFNKIQSLQQTLQELRGQIDEQNHELQILRDQQLAFYKDIDARLQNTPNITNLDAHKPIKEPSIQPNIPEPTASTHPFRGNPAEEQISYLAAYEMIKNKQFVPAMASMQAFIKKYPQGGYSANAHYWIGELYLTQHDYSQAIVQFDTVLNQFSSSNKASASLLKKAYALIYLGKQQEAKLILNEVTHKYPDTTMAKLAHAKLHDLS